MTIAPGSRLGPYEILSPLGAGGMGEVWKARDPRLGREVAVKVLPEELSSDSDRLKRFEQEARAAGVLNHPNIMAVHDVGSHEGFPYVVSELLEGETLRSRLAAGALPPRKAVDYATQIAHGLDISRPTERSCSSRSSPLPWARTTRSACGRLTARPSCAWARARRSRSPPTASPTPTMSPARSPSSTWPTD